MEDLKKFLINPKVKTVVLALFLVAIGILTSAAVNDYEKWWKWIVLAVFVAVYITSLVLYAKRETNLNEKIVELTDKVQETKKLFKIFQTSTQGINAMCKISAKQTNMKVHEIEEQGKIFCDNWNFDIASSLVCQQIYDQVICHICENNSYDGIADIEVGYVSLIENKQKKNRRPMTLIKLCGYYHPSRQNPPLYGIKREVILKGKDNKYYHDGALFEKKINTPYILMTKEEIAAETTLFVDRSDCCQYVGVPVFCDTADNNSKMVGLLEIVCHNECYLSNNKEDIKKYIDFYLAPYVSLLLLLFKNDKALRALPKPQVPNAASKK